MVANIHDGSTVEQLVSHDVVRLPKFVTARPPTEQLPSSSSSSPSSVAASDMHQCNNKVISQSLCKSLVTHSQFVRWLMCNWCTVSILEIYV